MSKKVLELPRIADPTIELVLSQYLKEAATSKKGSAAKREEAIDLFMSCLNNYAHQSLSKEETKLFDRYFEADGAEHKDFCQVFGPDKITENIGEFVGYFLVRKVMASATFLGKAAKEIEQLCRWLEENKYISAEEAAQGAERAAHSAKTLPRSAKASEILWHFAQAYDGPDKIVEDGYMDITKVGNDSLWLCPIGGDEFGPVVVPNEAAKLLEVGWEINCAVAKSGRKWFLVEVGNIYPH